MDQIDLIQCSALFRLFSWTENVFDNKHPIDEMRQYLVLALDVCVC